MLSVDCRGPEGNALAIMGNVRSILRQLRVPREEMEAYQKNAMSSDYNNLLTVSKEILDKHHIDYDFTNDPTDESTHDDDDYDETDSPR